MEGSAAASRVLLSKGKLTPWATAWSGRTNHLTSMRGSFVICSPGATTGHSEICKFVLESKLSVGGSSLGR